MPRYRDNQFVSNFLKPQDGEKTNAPFIYPRRRVRTYDDRSIREDAGIYAQAGYRRSKELDRGFMRNLSSPGQTQVGEFKRQRLNFQFNPSDILQSVQMRQDVYLPILQDPSQFAQPMSAVASFNFDLLFDRTMEVGRGASRPQGGTVDVFGDINPSDSVYEIGVLSDLQVLYSIIGQGFSNDFINQQLQTIKQLAKASLLDGEDLSTEASEIDAATVESFSGSANLGNNAFLIPMPVRIVFSELFMVDGFVTGTSVRFTKFNTNMVPIQASVGLSMNALYIGFAKEDTFLTVQLENQAENIRQESIAKIENERDVLNALRQTARQFSFSCWSEHEWKAAIYKSFNISNYITLESGSSGATSWNPDQYFSSGFKDAVSAGDNDKVLQLFKDGQSAGVSYQWTFKVYGPYDSGSAASAESGRPGDNFSSKPMVGLFRSGNLVASDEQSWRDIRAGRFDDTKNSGVTKNQSSTPITTQPPSDFDSKYFIAELKVSITSGQITLPIQHRKVLAGNEGFTYNQDLNWPSFNQPYQLPSSTDSTFRGSVGSSAGGFRS